MARAVAIRPSPEELQLGGAPRLNEKLKRAHKAEFLGGDLLEQREPRLARCISTERGHTELHRHHVRRLRR